MTTDSTLGKAFPGSQAHRLRVLIGENQRHDHLPVHEWIARRARDRGLAGATVYRAELGYGAASRANRTGLATLSADASMVVELVDAKEKLMEFLREMEEANVVRKGLVTLEPLQVLAYRSG